MGKNFSRNNVMGKRKKSDFYETPYALTKLLLDKVKLNGLILEPACGNNAIVKVLIEYGYQCIAYDLNHGHNFFEDNSHYDTIITNPPFSLAFEFIQHAKSVCDNFFFLLPLSYLHGKKRHDEIYMDKKYPLRGIFIFTRYPMLGEVLREDGLHNTGMMVYAWYWWDKNYSEEPKIDWLDNDPFIIRKNKNK